MFGIAEIELNLEAERVVIDELSRRQAQVGAEQYRVTAFVSTCIGFDQDDDIERVGEIFMPEGDLVDVNDEAPSLSTYFLAFRQARHSLPRIFVFRQCCDLASLKCQHNLG